MSATADVYTASGDTAVAAAIERNRVVDARARRVELTPDADRPRHRVGLVLDDGDGAMAAHVPLPSKAWDVAAAAGAIADSAGDPGRIVSFNASISANERPERITATAALLEESGLAASCTTIAPRAATRQELCGAHTEAHVDAMLACDVSATADSIDFDSGAGDAADVAATLLKAATHSNYVFIGLRSVRAALLAAGSVVEACEAVVEGRVDSAACVVRPPGHHSECGCAMGFCLFNSVAVAARALLRPPPAAESGGPSPSAAAPTRAGGAATAATAAASAPSSDSSTSKRVERVLIVDWDIHHGNGTQHVFADDPQVLYFSAHMFNTGWEYPMCAPTETKMSGAPEYVGDGDGAGFNINVGWNNGVIPCEGYGDAEYAACWQRLLLPVAREFEPDVVIVSAGFDSGAGDETGYGVTPLGYSYLTQELLKLPSVRGRVVVVLEGGYNVPAVARGMEACVASLLGALLEPPSDASFPAPSRHALADIRAAVDAHKPHWKCLREATGGDDIARD